ncbi:GT4 family glycosyltransferase PelF [Leucobacter sp. USHLN153]|uniref:GT4 family glycosyltransferase PelF n=1 Tax=Leucobacter sp. USHLN153 TaxID=3081268 RepID=UPI00301AC39A
MKQHRKFGPRVGLIGEGTYPVSMGGVSTWYDQLVRALPDHEFEVVTLVGDDRGSQWDRPENVTGVTLVPMWDQIPRARLRGRRAENRRVAAALNALWAATLPDGRSADPIGDAARALRQLADVNDRHALASTLDRVTGLDAIARAWAGHREANPELEPLSMYHAGQIDFLAIRMLSALDVQWPDVDVVHATTNGASALIGLARHWRDGTPLILTEHGVYLRERYLGLGEAHLELPVAMALLALTRVICQVVYREADVHAPVSEFNARWAEHLGADRERIRVVHNGVDDSKYAPIDTEPEVPTVSFVGRVDPLKDLGTLISAFARVTEHVPDARLRIFGPIPEENHGYLADLQAQLESLDLEESVTFEGKVPSARIAAEAGHVVALSSISEGLPYTVIESMMCGRATVSTDVGGVNEIVGRDGVAGALVSPRDPHAMAQELITLLVDGDARRNMASRGRARAAKVFALDRFANAYRSVYHEAKYGAPVTPITTDPQVETELAPVAELPARTEQAVAS